MVQKVYSNMHPVSCINTHHDVTDLISHGMVKNIKTWISWEWNIIFPRNKKILNLCLIWYILKVTFIVRNLKIVNVHKQPPGGVLLKVVLRNFAKLTGKHLCQSLFFNKVAGLGLELYLKRDSGTGVFLWILQNV